MSGEPDDTALMLRYRDGDMAAFEMLYGRHRAALYRFIARQSDSAAADDLFQDVWSRIIRGRASYRPSARFSTYLYRIARNCLIDHYRRRGHEHKLLRDTEPDEAASAEPGPRQSAAAAQTQQALQQALGNLPPEQREAFLLRAEAGFSLNEIAELTGVGRETVKSRLRYALSRLREQLPALTETENDHGSDRT